MTTICVESLRDCSKVCLEGRTHLQTSTVTLIIALQFRVHELVYAKVHSVGIQVEGQLNTTDYYESSVWMPVLKYAFDLHML